MNYREEAERLMEETDRRSTTYEERLERYERALREAAAEALEVLAPDIVDAVANNVTTLSAGEVGAVLMREAERIREGRDGE
jgi:hypothetical protein